MSKKDKPQTVDEAILYLFDSLNSQSRRNLKDMSKEELPSLHFFYGSGVRNSLGLWNPDNPLRKTPELSKYWHPDAMSTYLIERLWEYIQGIEFPSDGAESP